MKATLLIELLTEELPPKSLAKLGLSFREQLQKALAEAGFIAAGNEGRWFATPRRLALQFDDCLESQPDRVIEKKGPAVASGVGADGTPTKALEGFMRSAGVEFAQLEKQNDGKAEYFVARLKKTGERLDNVLAQMVEAALKKLPVAKLMRWGAGEAQFVRPVHGLILMHDGRTIAGEVLELTSRNVTRGHRFMSVGVIDIPRSEDYEAILEKEGRVIASFDKRRAMIVEQLDRAAGSLTWLRDEALLDEVTALVEFPAVYEASFEPEFLAVPQECLILTMKANQKYFPLMDGDKLSNRFLVVSNMKVADPSNIITGNARVVRPRLADAKFFFDQDRKKSLADRIPGLAKVVYHNKLGTQGERTQRVAAIASAIGAQLGGDELSRQAVQAALLAKADLLTDMVGEFPELQGIMGRYYALHDGLPADIANAIEDHYKPRFAGDSLPRNRVGLVIALADKLETLVGMFGIGQVPTGDKDPFALRRHALGIIRMLIEQDLPLDIDALLEHAIGVADSEDIQKAWAQSMHSQAEADAKRRSGGGAYTVSVGYSKRQIDSKTLQLASDFIYERLAGSLREQGYSTHEIDAVISLRPQRLGDIPKRLAAVRTFTALPEAASLAAANKRVGNILKKADSAVAPQVDTAMLKEPAEIALNAALAEVKPKADAAFQMGDYTGSLQSLAALRGPVDAFFDGVMVNAEDAALRANRLGLLATLHQAMNRVADISKLSA
jgi:glycyl-tRNA synthetase beta chain